MTDFVANYMATCKAVNAQVAYDVATVGLRWRAVVDVDAFMDWVSAKLASSGMAAAAKHCNRHDLAEYATWVAGEILHAGDPGIPEFATPAILLGEAAVDYWRAITIAFEMKQLYRA